MSLKDGVLSVDSEKEIIIKPESLIDKIIVNTNDVDEKQIQDYVGQISDDETGLIFLSKGVILITRTGTIEYSYNKLEIESLDKQDIINYFTGTNLIRTCLSIFIMSAVSFFIVYVFDVFIDVIGLALIGYVTALILRLRLRFIAMIKMAIHSLTLPIVLKLIYFIEQNTFGFNIKYFDIVYVTIAYIYIVSAILMIKADLIKRGEELNKIIEEEERLKQQLKEEKEEKERQERERKEEQKQEDKKEENNKKQEKKKNKKQEEQEDNENENTKQDEQPQGENA